MSDQQRVVCSECRGSGRIYDDLGPATDCPRCGGGRVVLAERAPATPLIEELRMKERRAILSVLDDLIAYNPRSQAERDYTRGVQDAIAVVRSRS